METVKERFEDAGEKDEEGYYDYYYAGFYFHFKEGKEVFVVRQYEDIPEEASFLQYSVKGERNLEQQHLEVIPYENPLFCMAVSHLIEKESIRYIKILLKGCITVDIKKATKTS